MTGSNITESPMYNATVGDIWRAWRGSRGPLRAFVDGYFDVATSPATDVFVREHGPRYPGKQIHSVEFYKRPDARELRLVYERAAMPDNGALRMIHPGYWQITLDDTVLTEATFGPLPVDAADGLLPPTAEGKEQINQVLDRLQETDFDMPVTVHQTVDRLGWPAFEINTEEAFYNACQVFGDVDLRTQLTDDGAHIRFDGQLRERLNEIRRRYGELESSPFILPTQLIFLEPNMLYRIYQRPPLPRYSASLRDRLALSDLSIEIFERLEKSKQKDASETQES